MDDSVRISAEKFRQIYQEGFESWAQLYCPTIDEKRPPQRLLVQEFFQQHPTLPRNLRLTSIPAGVLATGHSVWGANGSNCDRKMSSFRQQVQIRVAVDEPVLLSITEPSEGQSRALSHFEGDGDHLTILILAWTYLLSARWAELIPGICSLTYTDSQAISDQGKASGGSEEGLVKIQLGHVSPEEARWWAAILAPGQGWQADMMHEQQRFLSPWSTQLQNHPRFVLQHQALYTPSSQSAATFSIASQYLENFCTRLGIIDQCHMALACALLLPSTHGPKPMRLPIPRPGRTKFVDSSLDTPPDETHHRWVYDSQNVDKLLTFGCYARGVRPLLLSVFHHPGVECNTVTPWLQGTVAVIKHVAQNDPYVVGRMCMEQSPRVAFLWLGCILLDVQDEILRQVQYGLIPIDLHSGAWSGIVHSFIQQPVSNPLVQDGHVSRADECRLLFLSQSENRTRVPLCQWKPFGSTPIEDVDLEVRIHQQCKDHWLQYEGIEWECEDSIAEFQLPSKAGSTLNLSNELWPLRNENSPVKVAVDYGELNREREAISENATRNIFGWLRVNGYAQHEQGIWKHEWFDMSDDDEEELVEDEGSLEKPRKAPSCIGTWLSDVRPSTGDSTTLK